MRELLFRGKRNDGEWIEGIAFPHDNCGKVTMFRQNQGDGALEGFEVLPESVGQFTGLLDKNRKKIFEGDIIFDPEMKENHIVMFEEGGFCTEEMFLQAYLCFGEMDVEVIGNIHDNPELMGAHNEST